MKYLVASFSLLLICTSLFSQTVLSDAAAQANAEKQSASMVKYLLEKDYRTFCTYTYPPIIKMLGGFEKMVSYMEKSFKGMEAEGLTITNIIVKDCSKIVYTEKQLQCTLTEIITMKHAEGKLIQKSTLIGISDNKGITWSFIDTHGESLKKLQETIKELSNDLIIPEFEEPEVIAN